MVKDFNPKSSAKKKPVKAKGKKKPEIEKVKPVAIAPKAKKAESHSVKKKKKKPGFFTELFNTDRIPGEIDYTFLVLVGVLVVFGLIMLLSASTPKALSLYGRSYHFFLKQLFFVVLGAGLMVGLSLIDYRKLKPYTNILMIVCTILLIMVFLPRIGISRNGSRRWINLIFIDFQPSELMKVSIAMYFAAMIENNKWKLNEAKGFLKYIGWIVIVAALLLLETHLSGTIVICGIALCVLLAGGANAGIIVGGGAGALVAVVAVVATFLPTRMARLTNFFNPFTDMQGTGYQTAQSLYAIGSGGIFGKGLGESVQKLSFLPEPYNDFIFAVICEELGFVGAVFLIGLFITLILRGLKIAMEADDVFGSLTVVGIMAQVAIQTIFNIGVATASIPNTGVSLPFFSYGGTALMLLMAEMGIVLSVSRYSKKKK